MSFVKCEKYMYVVLQFFRVCFIYKLFIRASDKRTRDAHRGARAVTLSLALVQGGGGGLRGAGTSRRRDAGRPTVGAACCPARLGLGLGVLGEPGVGAHLLTVGDEELEGRLLIAHDAHGLRRLEDSQHPVDDADEKPRREHDHDALHVAYHTHMSQAHS